MKAGIENTYAEAFDGIYSRLLITAEQSLAGFWDNYNIEYNPLKLAAYRATATPSTVIGRIEGGIEKWLSKEETPDKRNGVVIQFLGKYNLKKPIDEQAEKFYEEMSIRIRQDILSASGGTTKVFNCLKAVETAMEKAILATIYIEGLEKISAGNYDGKLGRYKIFLQDLL